MLYLCWSRFRTENRFTLFLEPLHGQAGLKGDETEEFFARLKKQNPSPKTELEYKNPYTLLVAVALSAQATDKSVNKATAPLFKTIDTPEKMLALGEAKLTDAIKHSSDFIAARRRM